MSYVDKARKSITSYRVQQARYAALAVVDLADRVRGRSQPDLPPKRLRDFVGGGDFRVIGEDIVRKLQELADLKPTDRVLDVGSGIGRVAIPLTKVLDSQGGYDGIEIVKRGVTWCRRNITPAHGNFRFHHADIANATYNPRGAISAESYRFPFPDASFDVAVLTSVFTHLVPAVIEQYVAELGRVLAPGGRVFSTWLVLDDESQRLLAAGSGSVPLKHPFENGLVANPDSPEDAIGFPTQFIRDIFTRHGLEVRDPIHYGNWSGRPGVDGQDIVIAERATS